jgi:hypothetical protein
MRPGASTAVADATLRRQLAGDAAPHNDVASGQVCQPAGLLPSRWGRGPLAQGHMCCPQAVMACLPHWSLPRNAGQHERC